MSSHNKKGFVHKFYSDIMPMVYGFGAAIVIIGAMFKLLNLNGASVMLAAGLTTEAILFILGIFEPKYPEYKWEKAYPELIEEESAEESSEEIEDNNVIKVRNKKHNSSGSDENISLSSKLDEIFEKANIDAKLIERLGAGMNKIADYKDLSASFQNINIASDRYCEVINQTSNAMSDIAKSQDKISSVLASITDVNVAGAMYNEKMGNLVSTLNSIDDVYKDELSKIKARLSVLNSNYDNTNAAINDLKSIGESSSKFKEEMFSLSKKIESLNSMYGNMLNVFKSN